MKAIIKSLGVGIVWLVVGPTLTATISCVPSKAFVTIPSCITPRPSTLFARKRTLPSNTNDKKKNIPNDTNNSDKRPTPFPSTPPPPLNRPHPRRPNFPAFAYHLSKDESELKHNFISFIDQSILTSYSQTTRLVEPRKYARPDPFLTQNQQTYPTVDDLAPPNSLYGPLATFLAWNDLPARLVVGGMAYFAFPFIIHFLQTATKDLTNDDLISLVSTFLPGISIVLGTYFTLTLSILYDRLTNMQELVNLEAGLLAYTCNNLVYLYRDNPPAAIESTQCICDQIRIMVFDSRGKEAMGVIYNDPYARILAVLQQQHHNSTDDTNDGLILANVHSAVAELFTLRSKRMNLEALALAPTHFDVMTFLCGILMTGFALGTVATAQTNGQPNQLSSLLFASLVVVYTIFYEMSFDLNRPFDGVYQLRRSGAAMYFLQVKHIVCNHPMLAGHVDFEEIVEDEDANVPPDCDGECEQRKEDLWFN